MRHYKYISRALLNDTILDIIVFKADEAPENAQLARAKALIERIKARKLYVCVGRSAYEDDNKHISRAGHEDIKTQILEMSISGDALKTPEKSRGGVGSQDSQNSSYFSPRSEFGTPSGEYSQPTPIVWPSHVDYFSDPEDEEDKLVLTEKDLIVEKMEVHYGKKIHNPVSFLRFFKKGDNYADQAAKQIPDSSLKTHLPRCFMERAVRVFCRSKKKVPLAVEAFEKWCLKYNPSK
jgi:hypothetical protein